MHSLEGVDSHKDGGKRIWGADKFDMQQKKQGRLDE